MSGRAEDRAVRLWVALVHYPVVDRSGELISTSVTNLDVHDLARSACTFGAEGLAIVTPIASQREVVEHVLEFWKEPRNAARTPGRKQALSLVRVVADVDGARELASPGGVAPIKIATSARPRPSLPGAGGEPGPRGIGWRELRESIRSDPAVPRLLLLGTGWGLAPDLIRCCDLLVDPIDGPGVYNHLSVRSAGAIMLDRLLGPVTGP